MTSTRSPVKHKTAPPRNHEVDSSAIDRLPLHDAVEPPRAKPPEPSLEQRLADIDRRARERAVDEKRALATHYLEEARRAFRKAIADTTDEAVRSAFDRFQHLEKLTAESGGARPTAADENGSARPARGRPPRERVRRSAQSLAEEAGKIVDYLRDHPGAKAAAIMDATGVEVRPPLNIRTFVEKYLPDVKVKTDGQRASTVYTLG